jgi:hypothetical protein
MSGRARGPTQTVRVDPQPDTSDSDGSDDPDRDDGDDSLNAEIEALLKNVPHEFFSEHGFNPFNHWKSDTATLEKLQSELNEAVDKIAERNYDVCIIP